MCSDFQFVIHVFLLFKLKPLQRLITSTGIQITVFIKKNDSRKASQTDRIKVLMKINYLIKKRQFGNNNKLWSK